MSSVTRCWCDLINRYECSFSQMRIYLVKKIIETIYWFNMAHLQMSMHGNTSISITYDYRWTNVWNFTNHDQQECQSLIGKDAKMAKCWDGSIQTSCHSPTSAAFASFGAVTLIQILKLAEKENVMWLIGPIKELIGSFNVLDVM